MTSTTTTRSARVRAGLAGTLLLAPAVAAGALLVPATAAPGPATTTAADQAAAGYVDRLLAAGGGRINSFGFPDHGLTIDAVIALDAAGAGQTRAAAATTFVADDVETYISYYAPGDASTPPEQHYFANSTAKALFLAVVQGEDPSSFGSGGTDLVARLQSLMTAQGQFADQSSFGQYANTIGQTFGIIGLQRAGAGPDPLAVSFLRDLQCADGGFPLTPTPPGDTCTSHADASAFAAQALFAVGGSDDVDGEEALAYLAALQDDTTGGVADLSLAATPNANTTGLAGQAFHAGGWVAQARLASDYVRALQYGCTLPAAVRGGIAYDQAAYDARVAAGAGAVPIDQDTRSTTQALLTLAQTSLLEVGSAGAHDNAPELACSSPTTTTPPTSTTTTTTAPPSTTTTTSTTTSATTSGAVTTTDDDEAVLGAGSTRGAQAAPVRAAAAGSLAATGSDVLPVVLGAVALVAVGGGLLLSRRLPRGRHQ
jgi:hypothetical protein